MKPTQPTVLPTFLALHIALVILAKTKWHMVVYAMGSGAILSPSVGL